MGFVDNVNIVAANIANSIGENIGVLSLNRATIADMIAIPNPSTDLTCIVTDKNQGGTFVYDSTQSTVNNGGTIFNGWIRQYSGAVNVKWFGADHTGTEDSSKAFNLLINFLEVSSTNDSWKDLLGLSIELSKGTYKIDSDIVFDSFTHFNIIGYQAKLTGSGNIIFQNMKTFSIKNLFFYGLNLQIKSMYRGKVENIHLEQCTNSLIKNVWNTEFSSCKFIYTIMRVQGGNSLSFVSQSIENDSSIICDGLTTSLLFESIYAEWANHPIHLVYNSDVPFKGLIIKNSFFDSQRQSGKNWGTTYPSGVILLEDSRPDKTTQLLAEVIIDNTTFNSSQILPSNTRTEALIKAANTFSVLVNECSNIWNVSQNGTYEIRDIGFSGFNINGELSRTIFLSDTVTTNCDDSNINKFINYKQKGGVFNQLNAFNGNINSKGWIVTDSTETTNGGTYGNAILANSKFVNIINTSDIKIDRSKFDIELNIKGKVSVSVVGIKAGSTDVALSDVVIIDNTYYFGTFKISTYTINLSLFDSIKIVIDNTASSYYGYIKLVGSNASDGISNNYVTKSSPSLTNSWVNSSGSPLVCYRNENIISVNGMVNSGSNTENSVVATLSFKPFFNRYYSCLASGGTVGVEVNTNGELIVLAKDTHSGNANSNTIIDIEFYI